MNRLPVAVMAVAVLLLLMVPVSSAVAADGEDDALPQELYPDADIIVTEDDGSVLVTKRLSEPGSDGQTHTVQRYRQNSDLTLVDWTEVDGSVSIVFDGATVRNLTVLSLDTISDPEAPVDVEFTMVSGSATSITGVSAVLRVETALPDSHFTAYSPVSSLTMSIAGDVDVVSASDCLVEIGSIDISVKKGASIDRLYPSGEDGRSIDLSVTIAGGDVGYMSNQRCVVTYLDYDLKAGSVRYLCIGADVQDSDARYLGDLWTFYVQRDVDVSIGAEMDVGTAIVGGGILDAPTVLCNGESPALAQPRNVVLDAHDVTIRANPCFIASDTEVYDLSDYKIGGSVKRAELRDTVGVSSNRIAVYGGDGVWASHSDLTVPAGTVLYLDTDLWVTSGSTLSVEPAGTMVNGWFLILSGDLDVSGTFENNGVIERREGGQVNGDTIGEGIVATCIFPRLTDGKIDVMTVTDDAVVLRSQSGEMYFNSAMVRFGSTDSWVLISGPESMYVGGTEFVVSLEEGSGGSWDLYLAGFESSEDSLTVEVSVPYRVASGDVAVVTDSEGNRMEIVTDEEDAASGMVTFMATANGIYHVDSVPEGDDGSWLSLDPLVVNAIIAAAIVIVASVAVYFLLRRDRGPGPSCIRLRRRRRCRGRSRS